MKYHEYIVDNFCHTKGYLIKDLIRYEEVSKEIDGIEHYGFYGYFKCGKKDTEKVLLFFDTSWIKFLNKKYEFISKYTAVKDLMPQAIENCGNSIADGLYSIASTNAINGYKMRNDMCLMSYGIGFVPAIND